MRIGVKLDGPLRDENDMPLSDAAATLSLLQEIENNDVTVVVTSDDNGLWDADAMHWLETHLIYPKHVVFTDDIETLDVDILISSTAPDDNEQLCESHILPIWFTPTMPVSSDMPWFASWEDALQLVADLSEADMWGTPSFDMMAENEERVFSDTGGAKGRKPERFDLIPTHPLTLLARLYGIGGEKYGRVNGLDNWRNGYDWSLSYGAAQRHLTQFWSGKDFDDGQGGTGLPHLVAVAWHCFTLLEFMNDPELRAKFDDRQDGVRQRRA